MHVALVSPIYPPENGWGGIGTYVFHMARGLITLGHRVTVVCGYRDEPSESEEGTLRVVRRIRPDPAGALERSEQISNVLEPEVLGSGIDVVEFGEYGGDGAVFQTRHPGFPVVVKLHCPTQLCAIGENPPWQEWLRRRWLAPSAQRADQLERESVLRAHAVVAPSRWLLETLPQHGWSLPENRSVVPNPFGGWPGAEPALATGSDSTVGQVLVLGKLARIKGADLFPEIFARVWRELPEVRFELVGQDTQRSRRETWRQYVLRRSNPARRSQLIFRGGVPYSDLHSVLSRHEVALFASRLENAPYTVLECLWAGLACVVGSGGGAQEVGEHGVSALHTSRQPKEIAARVVELLRDAGLRQRLQAAARLRARARFDPVEIAREMTAIYGRAGARETFERPAGLTRPGSVRSGAFGEQQETESRA